MLERINENTIVYNGMRFTKSGGRKYYRSTKAKYDLHRYIWIHNNGEIPEGFHIHHKDGNVENNELSNLECINGRKHLSLHGKNLSEETKEKMRKNLAIQNPKAKEWHSSEEGKKWHKEHYEKTKDKLFVEIKLVCRCCGKEYTTTKHDSKFCSNNCRSKNRRNLGIDNVVKMCEYCGKEYISNKYQNIRFCSKSCSKKKS